MGAPTFDKSKNKKIQSSTHLILDSIGQLQLLRLENVRRTIELTSFLAAARRFAVNEISNIDNQETSQINI